MYTCFHCRFDVVLDDVAVLSTNGRCLCLRCYLREADKGLPMPKKLRQDVIDSLAIADLPDEARMPERFC